MTTSGAGAGLVPALTGEVWLAAVCGAGIGAGVLLLVVALRGEPRPAGRPGLLRVPGAPGRWLPAGRLGGGAAAGLLVGAVTRWPVAAAAASVAVAAGPGLFGGRSQARGSVDRLEAVASWTESLRDTLAGAASLEQAIPASAVTASPLIQPQLLALSARLHAREPVPSALRRFADDLADAGADLIVAALLLNAELRGPGLQRVLTELSTAVREELAMRRRVEASRASTRRAAQIIAGVMGLFGVYMVTLQRAYVAPYSTPAGQLALLVVAGVIALGFGLMSRLSRISPPPRLLPPAAGTTVPTASAWSAVGASGGGSR